MNKLGLIGLVLSLGAGCFGDMDLDLDFGPELGLQDAWSAPGLESRYMIGSVFPVEITRPERPVDEYEVVSLDPDVLRLTRTTEGFEAEALSLGNTNVELRDGDEIVRRYAVAVTQPDEIELMVEREDLIGADLTRARTAARDEIAMFAGQSVDVHVRYYEEGQRVYGGSVLRADTAMPTAVADWSPQGNVIHISPESTGTFAVEFRVGSLTETLHVHVTDTIASLELFEGEGDDAVLVADADGELAGDQVIRADARDAEGRLLHGTLPLSWTADLDGETTVLGGGTLLGVLSDGSEVPVTATLDGLSATFVARGLEMYVAP